MRLNKVLEILKEAELGKLKEGYSWNAAQYGFMRYALLFLQEIAESVKAKSRKNKRKSSAWNLFASKYLREGKTIQEAAKDWNKLKAK